MPMNMNFGNTGANSYAFNNGTGAYGTGMNPYAFNTGMPQTNSYNSMASFGMPSPTNGASGFTPGGIGTGTGTAGGLNLGFNVPTLQLGLGALSSLGGLYTGIKSLGQAQDQFNFQKGLATTNLNNSTQAYNTQLTDQATSRGVAEGQTSGQVQNYINANKLSS